MRYAVLRPILSCVLVRSLLASFVAAPPCCWQLVCLCALVCTRARASTLFVFFFPAFFLFPLLASLSFSFAFSICSFSFGNSCGAYGPVCNLFRCTWCRTQAAAGSACLLSSRVQTLPWGSVAYRASPVIPWALPVILCNFVTSYTGLCPSYSHIHVFLYVSECASTL